MTDKLSVDLAGLRASASGIQGHGDDLAVHHGATDIRVTSAGGGWTGQSSAALSAWAAKLRLQSAGLVNRLAEHSRQMHTAADRYGAGEDRRARDMAEVGGLPAADRPS